MHSKIVLHSKMIKAVSGADETSSYTCCGGQNHTETSGINQENERRKRTGSLQFWHLSAMTSLYQSPGHQQPTATKNYRNQW